jgi:hypothetical protein
MTTTTTNPFNPFPDVALPAGAVRVREWEWPNRTGHEKPLRYFDGTMRTVERLCGSDIEVQIEGTQFSDGNIERLVRVTFPGFHGGDDVLTADQARNLSAALAAAADELDALGTTST